MTKTDRTDALSLVAEIREMVKSERASSPVHVVQPINSTLNKLESVVRGSELQLDLDESDRQLVLLALAVLSLKNPGFDYALNNIAVRIDNVEEGRGVMYDSFRQLRASHEDPHAGCSCLHTTPCQPDCTCIKPFMSHGCMRCCSYGSPEQQKAMAEHLAPVIDASWEHKP